MFRLDTGYSEKRYKWAKVMTRIRYFSPSIDEYFDANNFVHQIDSPGWEGGIFNFD